MADVEVVNMNSATGPKTVTLCMIVKDEAHVIERCLSSVLPVIDYWVIVDTGSTDGTQQKIKDFFDRTYYPCEGQLAGLPYAVFVSAGNDGSGAVREIARIARGYGWRQAAEAMIVRGEFGEEALQEAAALGAAFATGIALGVF